VTARVELSVTSRALVYLRLGRVSNLPTVWTNALAAAVLVGGGVGPVLLPVCLVVSLFFTGGVYLNDAFDHAFDARRYPNRSIASGAVSLNTVFALGSAQLIAAVLLTAGVAAARPQVSLIQGPLIAVVLTVAIVYYDARHKTNPVAPFVMALCRALVFVLVGALVSAGASDRLLVGAALTAAYVLGSTYVAAGRGSLVAALTLLGFPIAYALSLLVRAESSVVPVTLFVAWVFRVVWLTTRGEGGAPIRVIPMLVVGISLFDAVLIAGVPGHGVTSWFAIGAAVLTLGAQCVVQET
jgi:hypothetical protein